MNSMKFHQESTEETAEEESFSENSVTWREPTTFSNKKVYTLDLAYSSSQSSSRPSPLKDFLFTP